jgi:hypothetical protein
MFTKENTHMAKTPYEIRLELLKLSTSILQTPIILKREALLTEYKSRREVFPGQNEPENPMDFPTFPDLPTTTQIIEEADKLNKFVCLG